MIMCTVELEKLNIDEYQRNFKYNLKVPDDMYKSHKKLNANILQVPNKVDMVLRKSQEKTFVESAKIKKKLKRVQKRPSSARIMCTVELERLNIGNIQRNFKDYLVIPYDIYKSHKKPNVDMLQVPNKVDMVLRKSQAKAVVESVNSKKKLKRVQKRPSSARLSVCHLKSAQCRVELERLNIDEFQRNFKYNFKVPDDTYKGFKEPYVNMLQLPDEADMVLRRSQATAVFKSENIEKKLERIQKSPITRNTSSAPDDLRKSSRLAEMHVDLSEDALCNRVWRGITVEEVEVAKEDHEHSDWSEEPSDCSEDSVVDWEEIIGLRRSSRVAEKDINLSEAALCGRVWRETASDAHIEVEGAIEDDEHSDRSEEPSDWNEDCNVDWEEIIDMEELGMESVKKAKAVFVESMNTIKKKPKRFLKRQIKKSTPSAPNDFQINRHLAKMHKDFSKDALCDRVWEGITVKGLRRSSRVAEKDINLSEAALCGRVWRETASDAHIELNQEVDVAKEDHENSDWSEEPSDCNEDSDVDWEEIIDVEELGIKTVKKMRRRSRRVAEMDISEAALRD